MTQPVSVSVVLPNWNGERLLRKNLSAVLTAVPKAEIIVTDDASNDGSVAFLREHFPGITVIENSSRQGFAGNVNRGVARATGDIVILLNTDVRPEAGFLEPILNRFTDRQVAAVGCMDKSHESGGITLRGRGQARWEKGYFIHSRGDVDGTDTAWVSGGSAAYRRSVWNRLGGMDTLYNPFYWEDIDLSYRMLKSGYRIVFEKRSVVHHFHDEGKIKTSFSPEDIRRISYRNLFLFHWKNISDPPLLLAHCVWTPIRLIRALFTGDWLMLLGYIEAIKRLPLAVTRRASARRTWVKGDLEIFPSGSHVPRFP